MLDTLHSNTGHSVVRPQGRTKGGSSAHADVSGNAWRGRAWGALVDVPTAWLPAVVYAALCFYVGKRDADGSPRAWAVLVRPFDSQTCTLALGLLALAAGLYVVGGPRGARER